MVPVNLKLEAVRKERGIAQARHAAGKDGRAGGAWRAERGGWRAVAVRACNEGGQAVAQRRQQDKHGIVNTPLSP